MNILFVCTGNTCRSPMAEGYLKSFGLPDFNVESRGLSDSGLPVSENSATAMREIGIDIGNHISKRLSKEDIENADIIVCMSASHFESLAPFCGDKLYLLGKSVSDPYGGSLETYRNCRDEIIKGINEMFGYLKVKPIERKHIGEIAKLERVCFSTPWSEDGIAESLANGTKFYAFCDSKNKVMGYIGISCVIDEGYVTNVAVFPEYRNKGIATALLKKCFYEAGKIPLCFISLEVRESNKTAISLYEKLGFKVEGQRKNFYSAPKEDALIMTKRF